jgi:hypothetical protein
MPCTRSIRRCRRTLLSVEELREASPLRRYTSTPWPSTILISLPLWRWKPTLTNFPRQPTQLGVFWATPSRLGAKAPKVTNTKHTILAKLMCLRFTVLSSALKQSPSQTQLKDITRTAQSHKERLGRAEQGYQAFLR